MKSTKVCFTFDQEIPFEVNGMIFDKLASLAKLVAKRCEKVACDFIVWTCKFDQPKAPQNSIRLITNVELRVGKNEQVVANSSFGPFYITINGFILNQKHVTEAQMLEAIMGTFSQ